MGVADVTEKILLSYNDVFADVVNVLLCGGKRIVKETMVDIFRKAHNDGIAIGFNQGRDADVKRALSDSAYLEELLANYRTSSISPLCQR